MLIAATYVTCNANKQTLFYYHIDNDKTDMYAYLLSMLARYDAFTFQ